MIARKEILFAYIKSNIAPILVDFIFDKDLDGAIILLANICAKKLNGHYDGSSFNPPNWFCEILNTKASKILVIDKIDSISKKEQLKFSELLGYRKISTFELPQNCIIIVTATEINKDKISKEIFSLVARI